MSSYDEYVIDFTPVYNSTAYNINVQLKDTIEPSRYPIPVRPPWAVWGMHFPAFHLRDVLVWLSIIEHILDNYEDVQNISSVM